MGGLQIAPSGEREKDFFLADEVTNFLRKMADPFGRQMKGYYA